MKGLRQHPVRVVGRLAWFGFEVLLALFAFVIKCIIFPGNSRRAERALWLHRTAWRIGRIFRLEIQSEETVPARGLLVCNHLSYVDIVMLLSLTPAVFVSKHEVKSWPVMGLLAQLGGTVFIDRQRRAHVGEVNQEIQAALEDGALVIIFPEGTSSDGFTILPFRSSLLEPPKQSQYPLTIGYIEYTLADGNPHEEVCYWGDAVFFPHLLNLLSKRSVRARVRFAPVPNRSPDRKQLALQLRSAIVKMRESGRNS